MSLINYRVASTSDIKGIAKVYSDTHININNELEKLNKSSNESFEKKGGHFLIFNKQEIMKILHDKKGEYFIAEKCIDGRNDIKGFIYCVFGHELYKDANYNIADSEYTKEDYLKFWESVKENKVFIAYEIAVKSNEIEQGISYGLMYEAFRRLESMGFRKGLAEVQQVQGISDTRGIYKATNMTNRKSTHILRKIGSRKIGEKNVPHRKIGDKKIHIKSIIYEFDIDDALTFLGTKVNE